MKKSTKIIILLLVTILILSLFLTLKIYATAKKENETNTIAEDIYKIGTTKKETNNTLEQEQTDTPIIIPTTIEETQNEESKTNTPYKTTTYTASNGKSYEVIATLNIPSLGIEYPVLSTTSTEALKIALNKYWGPNPNEEGNLVIVGHNYKNKKFFGKLSKIQKGSIVKITDTTGKTLDYKVYETDVIDPYDNSCTSQLTNGNTEITLITCYNNGKQRFIAKARAE